MDLMPQAHSTVRFLAWLDEQPADRRFARGCEGCAIARYFDDVCPGHRHAVLEYDRHVRVHQLVESEQDSPYVEGVCYELTSDEVRLFRLLAPRLPAAYTAADVRGKLRELIAPLDLEEVS